MLFDSPDGPSQLPEHSVAASAQILSSAGGKNEPALPGGGHSSRVIGFGGSDRLSILFAMFTLICGLYCTGYLFRSPDPEHRFTPWPREFFYQRPPELMASGASSGNQKKAENSSQLSGAKPSSPRSGNADQPATDHSSSPSVPDKGSLTPGRNSDQAVGSPYQNAASSTNRGNSDAKESSAQTQTAMKAAKKTSQKHAGKNSVSCKKSNQGSGGPHAATSKSQIQNTSRMPGGNHPQTAGNDSAHNAGTGALPSSRRDSSSQRSFSGMRSMPGRR